jgi:phosphoribosylformylglycinamidine cyclo-ligase
VVRPLFPRQTLKGLAHITGGGITENLPRVLPEGCSAEIDLRAWSVPALFQLLQERGQIPRDEMFRAFNMGIGLVLVCAPAETERVINTLARNGEPRAVRIGFVVSGSREVIYV